MRKIKKVIRMTMMTRRMNEVKMKIIMKRMEMKMIGMKVVMKMMMKIEMMITQSYLLTIHYDPGILFLIFLFIFTYSILGRRDRVL